MYTYESDTTTRDWVIENILPKARAIYPTQGRFTTFDIIYLPQERLDKNGNDINNRERAIEIKNRHFNHDKFTTTYIERDKYEAMTASTHYVRLEAELVVKFEDGILYYNAKDLEDNFMGYEQRKAPDQHDAYNDKWSTPVKEFASIRINDKKFFTYEQIKNRNNRGTC